MAPQVQMLASHPDVAHPLIWGLDWSGGGRADHAVFGYCYYDSWPDVHQIDM